VPYRIANDPQHWRDCAEEMRAMAASLIDSAARQTLLKVAAGYDEMARKAEQQVLFRPCAESRSSHKH